MRFPYEIKFTHISATMTPLLVVFDLNGTLLDSTHRKRPGVRENARARHKFVYYRPHLHTFMEWILRQPGITVAFWTSNIQANAERLVQLIVPRKSDRDRLAFVWHRGHCMTFADYSSKKPFQKVFDLGYETAHTLMVDDTDEKIMHPQKDRFYCKITSFEANPESIVSDTSLLHLQKFLERVVATRNATRNNGACPR